MKILIIRLSSMGDVVLTQGVAAKLRDKFPAAQIDFMTKPQYRGVVKAFTNIDSIFLWGKNKPSLLRKLRKQNYDIVYDLQAKFNTFIIKTLIKAKKTITYKKKHFLRWLIIKKMSAKTIDSTLALYFSVFDNSKDYTQYRPKLTPQHKIDLSHYLDELDRKKKLIGIFPGAKHKTKIYPITKLQVLINRLSVEHEYTFILLGSEQEHALCKRLERMTNFRTLNLCDEFSTGKLIAFMDKLDLIISNDSGPMHIAAALRKPQIAIFGSTSTKLGFKPLNKKAIVLETDLNCQPCSLHGRKKCPRTHFNCMRNINPQQLANGICELV